MLMGVLLLGKRYSWVQYICALLLCFGVVGCTYADKWVASGQSSSATGVCLLLVAVCCDAISPVVQERMLGKYAVGAAELMVRTNLIALIGILAAWAISRESDAYATLPPDLDHSWLLLTLSVYGASSYVGVSFMLALIEVWGSAVSVAVGTLRKVVTIVLSFLWWSKPFSATFALSGLAVVAALVLNSYAQKIDAALCAKG